MKKFLLVLALLVSLSSCYVEPPYYSQCGQVVGPGYVEYTTWGSRYWLPIRMYSGYVMDVVVDEYTWYHSCTGSRICF